MTKITRTCDNCGKLIRSIEKYEPMRINGVESKYKKLCKDCFDLWLEGELEE